ncbi:MAG: TolC family protein [Candidatus Omnitrophica bacterium]|nr:TolC family protein [Candidatus Omnitrophota bacterium]
MFIKHIVSGVLILILMVGNIPAALAESEISKREAQIRSQEAHIKEDYNESSDELTAESGLDDYIRIGLQRNPELKASFYEWKAALKKVPQAFSLPDPQFTYTDYLESVETRVGPQNRAFSINQKIPLPDKLWIRKARAFKASEVTYYKFEKQRLSLIYQMTDAFYEYAYLAKAILVTQENMKLLSNIESVAQTKYASGLTKNQDLLKVQVELGKLENELLTLKDLKSALMARLNSLLNFPEDHLLPFPNESLEDMEMTSGYDTLTELVKELQDSNPELMASFKNIEKEKDNLKLAKREYFPDLTVGVTTIDTGEAMNPATIDSGKDPLMVMFSVNVPIWFDRLYAGVEEARSSLKAAEEQYQSKGNELYSRLALTHYKMKDALRQTRLYKDALIPKAVQTLNATQSGYEAGSVDFLSLIDAQRMLLNFQLAYYRFHANYHQRVMELRMLLGEIDMYKDSESTQKESSR